MTRIYSLDFFRGVAIVLVLCSHLGYLYGLDYAYIFGVGRYGVILFYIISGYTIFYNLFAKKHNKTSIINFYIRRFFRIAPLFYILLFVVYVVDGRFSISSIVFLGFLDANSFNRLLHVEWSIYVEILFYLIAPFLFFFLREKQLQVLIFFVFISILWRSYFYSDFFVSEHLKQYYFFSPVNFLYTFFIGSTLYKYVHNKPFLDKKVLVIVLLLMLVLIIVLKGFLGDSFFIVSDYMFSVLFALIVYIKFVYYEKIRFLIIESVGIISYSLYLWHYLILSIVSVYIITSNIFIDIVIGILLLLLTSIISYFIIEKNGIKAGRFFSK